MKTRQKIMYRNPFSQVNEQTKYWMGYLAADGCLVNNVIKVKSIDKEHLLNFSAYAGNLVVKTLKQKSGNPIYECSFSSQDSCKVLEGFGITKQKSLTLEIKNTEIDYPFLLGYFDGNGCVTHLNTGKPKVEIGTGSLKFHKQVLKFCSDQNLKPRSYIYKPKYVRKDGSSAAPYYKILIARYKSTDTLFKEFYSLDVTYLERKYRKFLSLRHDIV